MFEFRTIRSGGWCRALCLGLGALAVAAGGVAQAGITDGMSWWQGDDATGWSAEGMKFAGAKPYPEGRVGKALLSGVDSGITAAGILNGAAGSWAAWVRREDGNSTLQHLCLFTLTGDNFRLVIEIPKSRFFFMTGGYESTPDRPFRWDYSAAAPVPAGWGQGAWRHVAVTWDQKGGKQLWLDGKLASSGSAAFLQRTVSGRNALELGGDNAPCAFDEVMLWKRVLTPEEIGRLAGQPEEVAQEVTRSLAQGADAMAVAPFPLTIPILSTPDNDPAACILEPGQTRETLVPVKNPGREAWSGTLRLVWTDWRGQTAGESEQPLQLNPGEEKKLPVTLRTSGNNLYKLTAVVRVGDKTLTRDVTTLASWPKPRADRPFGFFGHHINSFNQKNTLAAKRLGVRMVRDHNMLQSTWWTRVEPEDGKFDWRLEANLRFWRPNAVLGQIFGTPEWAPATGPRMARQPERYPSGSVPREEAFLRYVRTMVEHYKNDVREWEIWNEPECSMFWQGSPQELSHFANLAAQEIRKIQPNAVVMAPGFTSDFWGWHKDFAAAGGYRNMDALSFHAYHSATDDHEVQWLRIKSLTDHFKEMARKSAGRELPLWDTEGCPGDDSWLHNVDVKGLAPESTRDPLNPVRAAYSEVFFNAMLMECGVVRSYSYLWNPGINHYDGLNAVELSNTPKLRTLARQAMDDLVGLLPHQGLMRREEGRLRASFWKDGGNTVVLFYAGQEAQLSARIKWPGKALRKLDILGNELPVENTDAPVLLGEEPVYYAIAADVAAVKKSVADAAVTVVTPAKELPVVAQDKGHGVPVLPPYPAALERGPGMQKMIDLSAAANMGFADEKAGDGKGGWADEGPYNSLVPAPIGEQTYYGVRFRILDPAKNQGRAVITLQGVTVPNHPTASKPIALDGVKANRLWFLHASNWSGKAGRQIATYRIRYQNGSEEKMPVVVDRSIRDWWLGYEENALCKPVPLRITNGSKGEEWRYLHTAEWTNPHPELPLESVTLESERTGAAVILVAITAGL